MARLTSVYKKDSPNDKSNHKPISVLPIIPEPLERHVASSYPKPDKQIKGLYSKQSAYRPKHSYETGSSVEPHRQLAKS